VPPRSHSTTSSRPHDLHRQNNSITESTLRAQVAQVQHNQPELVRILDEAGQHAGFGPSSTMIGSPRMEDVVARTNEALGPALHRMRQDS